MKRRDFLQTAALTPLMLAATPQGEDLAKKFETMRAADPIAALKFLAGNTGDAPAKIARPAISKQIGADVAAGLKAIAEEKPDQAELPFARAALLADLYAPEFSKQLMRLVFLAKLPRKVPTGCASCKGVGGTPCATCQATGLATGPCPRCEAKGNVPCLLCDGSGTLDHRGYKGTLVLSVDRDTRVSFKNDQGKSVSGKLLAQTLTYQMSPCSGGSFQLQTESAPAKGAKTTGNANQPCTKFWTEMKMFVFNGKAKIKVNNNKGQLTPIGSAAARRFLSDYETCASGKVPCDRCTGRKTDPCSLCRGSGKAPLPCAACEGAAMIACATCKGFGSSVWLAALLPAAPVLGRALSEQAEILRAWIGERARRAQRQADFARRLEEAKKGNDPTAKVTTDFVEIVCPRCKGNGGECEECWGAGRREYYEGTSQYERYAVVEKFARQLAELQKTPLAPPTLAPLPDSEGDPSAAKPGPLPVRPAAPPVEIPKSVDETIAKADALHETGKAHLEKSKATSDNAVWIDEGMKALADFKSAQILYTSAQEKLDEAGATVPRTLLDKFRTNMQGLVMARKQVP